MHQLARVSGVVLSAALLLPLAACGGSGKSGEKGPSEDEVAAVSLASNMTSISPDLALCTAQAVVESVTVSGLKEAGILDDDLVARTKANAYSHETATSITDAAMGCWDWEKYAMGVAGSYPRSSDAQWTAYQTCLGELDDELEKSLYASYYKDGKASDQLIFRTEEEICRKQLVPRKKR